MALVGSCLPSSGDLAIVVIVCRTLGCHFSVAAMSEKAAIGHLNEHLNYERYVDQQFTVALVSGKRPQ